MKQTQFIPTIVMDSDGTQHIENVPCGALSETKFSASADSKKKEEKKTKKKFTPKFG